MKIMKKQRALPQDGDIALYFPRNKLNLTSLFVLCFYQQLTHLLAFFF